MREMAVLRDKRKALLQKRNKNKMMLKDIYEDQKDHSHQQEVSRLRARQKVFANADVVCATLSGAGHDMLASMCVSFDTVIVDEAAQSIEISSLIPLKYDTHRCILVGDPNQLPPTVISMVATKYNYQQSLFMRLENSIGNEVNLLRVQYRMHPEISRFPSQIFYKSKLSDGPDMATVTSALWHHRPEFPPYSFFNVLDGHEKLGRGKSIFNTAEADAAVALVDMLATKFPTIKFGGKIGVITPYKQQLSHIKSRFTRKFGSNILDMIDFNTVDGFQGQEKDIIIFSCVRAGPGRGIGFLADMRRMNVGLTRAKSSLFVLGHATSLSRSDYWGDLVMDSKRRDLMVDCEYPYFKHRLSNFGTTPNLFEREVLIATKSKYKHKPRASRIAIPEVGSPRPSSPVARDVAMKEVAPDNEERFLEKVRNLKANTTKPATSEEPEKRLSLQEFRNARGVKRPNASSDVLFVPKSNRGTRSNLFIDKNKARTPVSFGG
jgi:superfamily I DNA and/or RNA helicase